MTWLICRECADVVARRRRAGATASCLECRKIPECGGCRVLVTVGALTPAGAA